LTSLAAMLLSLYLIVLAGKPDLKLRR